MNITILQRYPTDRSLEKGEASKVKKSDGTYTLLMPCPRCGTEMILAGHNITWHKENLITVEPSLVCDAITKTYSDQILHDIDNCMAHFYIKKNIIVDLAN